MAEAALPPEPVFPPGVSPLDHTADVGLDVHASSLAELFHRAALGAMVLLREPTGPAATGAPARRLVLESGDVAQLLVRWLREILYLHDVHGFVYRAARFEQLDERGLAAMVDGTVASPDAGGELKAVTYHGLDVSRTGTVWRARVIFDV